MNQSFGTIKVSSLFVRWFSSFVRLLLKLYYGDVPITLKGLDLCWALKVIEQ